MPRFPAKLRDELIDDHTLFKTIISTDSLLDAWSHVWANGGCSGGDGVTLERFRQGVSQRIFYLRRDLRTGDYVPGPLRHVTIPKKDGTGRPLAIPCVVDRVAQTAVMQALMPLLDEEFEESSFGYRRGRSVQQAVRRVSTLQRRGAAWVVDADIEGYFENVPHEKLLDRLAQSMTQGPLSALIALWLEHGGEGGRGLPQGGPLSPLLANLYLDRLDEAFEKRGARIVRYADDFVILCENESSAERALEKTRNLLGEYGLAINEDKTRVVSFDQGFRFLGHMFVRSLVLKSAARHDEREAMQLMRQVARGDEEEARERARAEAALQRKRRAGLDPGLRVLYVMEPGRRLSIRNEAFSVLEMSGTPATGHEWREILALPNKEVDRIEIGPQAGADGEALELALASDTPLAFVNGWGETLGWLAPQFGPRAGRHLAQAGAILDEDRRLDLAQRFVDGRLRNQRALLRRLNRSRKAPKTLKSLAGINLMIRRVRHEKSLAALMGVEGRATALYWPALGRALKYGFRFSRRGREGRLNPVNIMLNMTTHMLARDVTVCLQRAGLHPGLGMLHASDDYRDALVYDLMEEFRAPLCESVVVTAINTRAVSMDMFAPRSGGGKRMKPEATRALIRAYERAASRPVKSRLSGERRMWRHIITEQAYLLAAHIEGRDEYRSHVMDY